MIWAIAVLKILFQERVMKKICVLLLVALSFLGCGKEKSKEVGNAPVQKAAKDIVLIKYSTSGTKLTEKNKAVNWIKNNNKWGTEKKPKGIIAVVEGYINGAIEAGDKKKPGSNIYIAISGKALKSGKDSIMVWKDNTFSVREMTDIEKGTMKVPENGLKMDKL